MNAIALQSYWKKYLSSFVEHNAGRQTRLGVFEPANVSFTDYWIESGLPFVDAFLDSRDKAHSFEIRVGSLTHQVKNVAGFAIRFSINGDEDGLDVTDGDGRTTVLRFEA